MGKRGERIERVKGRGRGRGLPKPGAQEEEKEEPRSAEQLLSRIQEERAA